MSEIAERSNVITAPSLLDMYSANPVLLCDSLESYEGSKWKDVASGTFLYGQFAKVGDLVTPTARVYGDLFDNVTGGRDKFANIFASPQWTVEIVTRASASNVFGDISGWSTGVNLYIPSLTTETRRVICGELGGDPNKYSAGQMCVIHAISYGETSKVVINQQLAVNGAGMHTRNEYCGYAFENCEYGRLAIYDRALDDDELKADYETDKKRFGI